MSTPSAAPQSLPQDSLADLLEHMHRFAYAAPPPLSTHRGKSVRIKIVTAGNVGAGKSCLIKRYCEEKFVTKYISTIGVDYGVKRVNIEGTTVKVNFWDLSGHADFAEVRSEFYIDTQGLILVFDVSSRKSFDDLQLWLNEASRHGVQTPIAVLCANKCDLRETKKNCVGEKEGRSWAMEHGMPYFETSSLTGAQVKEMFNYLFSKVIERVRPK
eukprot:TRINITY_DN8222_c0_g1_i2.p1 TRINITY_DN8222_c0_g1~~TRINITY_DN8222_c0_g1_i2.p1  ORF type:complete len:214 (-),score=43.12 TRINITY_DN8222_c0_g1_i2:77-718(-)